MPASYPLSKSFATLLLLAAAAAGAGCMSGTHAVATIAYTAHDYSFDGPSEVTGDVIALQLTNAGQQAHHIALARLDAGHSTAEFLQALAANNGTEAIAWAHWSGGAGPFMPGGTGTAYLNLVPGTYVMVCFVPDMQGVPHFMHGMSKEITVKAAAGAAPKEPAHDLTITQRDFSFDLDAVPTAGTHNILVENKGAQTHEAILARLNAGTTGMQFVSAFGPNATGPPPGQFVGGLSEQDPGMHGAFTVNLTPGHYALICFVSDPQSKAPHFALGMMKEFDVA